MTWRLYKRFFIWKKKLNFFIKFKLFFTYSKVIKKYLIKTYGYKNSNFLCSVYKKYLKITTNKIYSFLYKLEFRLDLILIRIYFIKTLEKSHQLIKSNGIVINNKIVGHKHYNICFSDVIQFNLFYLSKPTIFLKLWKKKKQFQYKFLFRYQVKNFLEINYNIGMFIYIKFYWSNEFIKKKKIKILNFSLFKKYWGFV